MHKIKLIAWLYNYMLKFCYLDNILILKGQETTIYLTEQQKMKGLTFSFAFSTREVRLELDS